MADSLPIPVAKSVLMADQIIVEADSSKKTLVGVFSCLNLARLPARRQINAYFELTDACGEYNFKLQIAHLESGKVVSGGEISAVKADCRLESLEIVVRIPVCFREYGVYEMRLLHEGNVFASRILRVLPTELNLSDSHSMSSRPETEN